MAFISRCYCTYSGRRRDGYGRRDLAIAANRGTQAVLLVCYLETKGWHRTQLTPLKLIRNIWKLACFTDTEGENR